MHPAPAFQVRNVEPLLARIAAHPFMTLAAAPGGLPLIAHAPVVIRRLAGGLALDFHLSRRNALANALESGFHGVLLGLGPDAYVSPDWYESADQVPTWNYLSVEAHGTLGPMTEPELVTLLDDLSAVEETRLAPKPVWTRDKMSPGRFEAMLGGIVGARLTVSKLQGTTKLSQNKTAEDRAGVIAALGDHPIARRMADLP